MFERFQAVIYPKEIIRNTKKNSTINFSFHNKQQLEKALKTEQGILYYFHVLESCVRFCLQKQERRLSEGELAQAWGPEFIFQHPGEKSGAAASPLLRVLWGARAGGRWGLLAASPAPASE